MNTYFWMFDVFELHQTDSTPFGISFEKYVRTGLSEVSNFIVPKAEKFGGGSCQIINMKYCRSLQMWHNWQSIQFNCRFMAGPPRHCHDPRPLEMSHCWAWIMRFISKARQILKLWYEFVFWIADAKSNGWGFVKKACVLFSFLHSWQHCQHYHCLSNIVKQETNTWWLPFKLITQSLSTSVTVTFGLICGRFWKSRRNFLHRFKIRLTELGRQIMLWNKRVEDAHH